VKNCPYCANQIQDAAIKCQFCGERLDAQPAASAASARTRRRRGLHPLLVLYIVAGCAAFGAAAVYLRDQDRALAAAAAVGAAIVFVPLAPIAWAIGDVVRRFANPSAYFVSGGAMALAQTRLYWMIGPQSVAVFVVFAALGVGVLRTSMADMTETHARAAGGAAAAAIQPASDQAAAVTKVEPPPAQAAPALQAQTGVEIAPTASSAEPEAASSAPVLAN